MFHPPSLPPVSSENSLLFGASLFPVLFPAGILLWQCSWCWTASTGLIATGDPYKCFQPGFWPCGVDWERGALRLKWSIFWNEVLLGCVGMELAQASSRVFALKLCAWRTCQSTHSLFWVCVGFTIVVSRLQLGSVPVGRIIILALWLWR